jgi:hypothetical protein
MGVAGRLGQIRNGQALHARHDDLLAGSDIVRAASSPPPMHTTPGRHSAIASRLANIELEGRPHLAYRLTGKGCDRLDMPLAQRVHDGRLHQFELFDHRHGRGS